MIVLFVCLIYFILNSVQDCNFSKNSFTCNGGNSKSIMFDFNSKNQNSTIVQMLEFLHLENDSVTTFLESAEEDVKQEIKAIKIQFCELTEVPEVIKSDYPNLETLDLQHNNIETLDFVHTLNQDLKQLYLGFNKLSTVSEVFSNLTSLEVVDLSNCEIENLNFMVFKDNANLSLVNASHNKIETSISEEYLKNIKCVDLSYNILTNYSNVPSLCLDFSYTNLNGYYLYKISEQNKSVVIEKFYFCGNSKLKLRATNVKNESLPILIKYLNISRFQGDIEDLNLKGVKVRKEFILNDANIVLDKSKYDFFELFYSEGTNATFDLTNCSITDIPSYYFENYNLGKLNLCFNKLTHLKSNVFKDAYIVELNLCNSDIDDIDDGAFTGLHVSLLNLSKNKLQKVNFFNSINTVRVIDLSDNNINTLYSNQFMYLKDLEKIELSRNDIVSLDRDIFNNNKLKIIGLSGNKLSRIKSGTFSKISNLREIYLDNNPITVIDNNAFLDLPSLKLLSLDNTDVYVIKSNAFGNIQNLDKVYLRNNQVNDLHLICKIFN